MKTIRNYALILVTVLGFNAQNQASEGPTQTIVEIAQSTNTFNTLLAAVGAAELASWVDNAAPKTLFAPTDDAFAKLPAGTVESLLLPENKETLTQILLFHLVDGSVTSGQLSTGYVETLSRTGLWVNTSNGVVLNGNANVTTPDVLAKNGVIHIIDEVLLPPSDNIVDLVAADPELSTLAAALTAADLLNTVRDGRPFTVFAPTNAAFEALPAGVLDSLLLPENKGDLANILLYHVVAGSVYSNNLANGPVGMVNGGSITVDTTGPIFEFTGGAASPVAVDIVANNGVVHKIDKVLLPSSEDLVAVLSGDSRFSTLVTAVGAAELVEAIQGLGGATIFAPTNAAFEALPAGMLQLLLQPENKALLQNVILYHTLVANYYAAGLQTNVYPTLAGAELPIMVDTNGVTVDFGPMVSEANILASNGVIHAIDGVILPPLNMADTLKQDGRYTTLVAALEATGLFATLNTAGPFTLLAPTDTAFAKLPAGTLETLLAEEGLTTLTNILLAHVIDGRRDAGELLTAPFDTLQGKTINLHWVGDHLMIGDEAVVTKSDFPVWNGTIHTIDTVLLP